MPTYKSSVNGCNIETIVEKKGGFTIARGKVMPLTRDLDPVRFSIETEVRQGAARRVLFVNLPPTLKNQRVPLALAAGQVAYEECARLLTLLDAIEEGDLGYEVDGLVRERELARISQMIELAYHVEGKINEKSIKDVFVAVISILSKDRYSGSATSLKNILGLQLFASLRSLAATYYEEEQASVDTLIRAVDEFSALLAD